MITWTIEAVWLVKSLITKDIFVFCLFVSSIWNHNMWSSLYNTYPCQKHIIIAPYMHEYIVQTMVFFVMPFLALNLNK